MKVLILLAFSFLSLQNLNAQDYLYVYPSSQNALPNDSNQSNNENLNDIFEQFHVTRYVQSFPSALTPIVTNTYHIYADKNINSLKYILFETGLFDSITKTELYNTSCVGGHPPINDLEITSDRFSNWALDKIETNCAQSITKRDPRVILTITDTDIDTFHEDLRKKFVKI